MHLWKPLSQQVFKSCHDSYTNSNNDSHNSIAYILDQVVFSIFYSFEFFSPVSMFRFSSPNRCFISNTWPSD